MPWDHCAATGILDTEPCPECGFTKEQWTLEADVTRQFTVKRVPTLRLVLLDSEEEGVAGEPYRVVLPDGTEHEGELDEQGAAKIRHAQQGECTVVFPRRAPGFVVPFVPPSEEDAEEEDAEEEDAEEEDAEEEDAGEEDAEEEDAEEEDAEEEDAEEEDSLAVATFSQLTADERHRFQLRPHFLQLTLLDRACHHRLPFLAYSLEGEEGTTYEGVTDGWGRLDHGAVALRRYRLAVGEGTVVVPAVLGASAFLSIRLPHVVFERNHAVREAPEDEGQANPRWSTARCRLGEPVELIYEAAGAADGEEVYFEVFEQDAGGEDDFVMGLTAPVLDGVARAGWHMLSFDDSDDEPTAVDRETGFNLPEFVFVAHHGDREARCEDPLVFSTDLELPLEDMSGRRLANTDYELICGEQILRGTTDAEGIIRERGVGPNFEVRLGDDLVVAIVQTGERSS